jgi:hypothetical protein
MIPDVYVQITATPDRSERSKTVVVFVPGETISNLSPEAGGRKLDVEAVAGSLAEPIARNVFTHRASFGPFQLGYSFSTKQPPEISGQPPEFLQADLKAWII